MRRAPAGAALLALAACAPAAPAFRDDTGQPVSPWPAAGDRALVWVFTAVDCPIANGEAPALGAALRAFAQGGVRTLLVYVDTADPAAIAAHRRAHDLPGPAVADPQRLLVRAAGATVTPSAAVFDARGALRYLGRIDDQWRELGVRRPAPTQHDLRDAVAAVLAGREVAAARTPAVGCAIEAAPR